MAKPLLFLTLVILVCTNCLSSIFSRDKLMIPIVLFQSLWMFI